MNLVKLRRKRKLATYTSNKIRKRNAATATKLTKIRLRKTSSTRRRPTKQTFVNRASNIFEQEIHFSKPPSFAKSFAKPQTKEADLTKPQFNTYKEDLLMTVVTETDSSLNVNRRVTRSLSRKQQSQNNVIIQENHSQHILSNQSCAVNKSSQSVTKLPMSKALKILPISQEAKHPTDPKSSKIKNRGSQRAASKNTSTKVKQGRTRSTLTSGTTPFYISAFNDFGQESIPPLVFNSRAWVSQKSSKCRSARKLYKSPSSPVVVTSSDQDDDVKSICELNNSNIKKKHFGGKSVKGSPAYSSKNTKQEIEKPPMFPKSSAGHACHFHHSRKGIPDSADGGVGTQMIANKIDEGNVTCQTTLGLTDASVTSINSMISMTVSDGKSWQEVEADEPHQLSISETVDAKDVTCCNCNNISISSHHTHEVEAQLQESLVQVSVSETDNVKTFTNSRNDSICISSPWMQEFEADSLEVDRSAKLLTYQQLAKQNPFLPYRPCEGECVSVVVNGRLHKCIVSQCFPEGAFLCNFDGCKTDEFFQYLVTPEKSLPEFRLHNAVVDTKNNETAFNVDTCKSEKSVEYCKNYSLAWASENICCAPQLSPLTSSGELTQQMNSCVEDSSLVDFLKILDCNECFSVDKSSSHNAVSAKGANGSESATSGEYLQRRADDAAAEHSTSSVSSNSTTNCSEDLSVLQPFEETYCNNSELKKTEADIVVPSEKKSLECDTSKEMEQISDESFVMIYDENSINNVKTVENKQNLSRELEEFNFQQLDGGEIFFKLPQKKTKKEFVMYEPSSINGTMTNNLPKCSVKEISLLDGQTMPFSGTSLQVKLPTVVVNESARKCLASSSRRHGCETKDSLCSPLLTPCFTSTPDNDRHILKLSSAESCESESKTAEKQSLVFYDSGANHSHANKDFGSRSPTATRHVTDFNSCSGMCLNEHISPMTSSNSLDINQTTSNSYINKCAIEQSFHSVMDIVNIESPDITTNFAVSAADSKIFTNKRKGSDSVSFETAKDFLDCLSNSTTCSLVDESLFFDDQFIFMKHGSTEALAKQVVVTAKNGAKNVEKQVAQMVDDIVQQVVVSNDERLGSMINQMENSTIMNKVPDAAPVYTDENNIFENAPIHSSQTEDIFICEQSNGDNNLASKSESTLRKTAFITTQKSDSGFFAIGNKFQTCEQQMFSLESRSFPGDTNELSQNVQVLCSASLQDLSQINKKGIRQAKLKEVQMHDACASSSCIHIDNEQASVPLYSGTGTTNLRKIYDEKNDQPLPAFGFSSMCEDYDLNRIIQNDTGIALKKPDSSKHVLVDAMSGNSGNIDKSEARRLSHPSDTIIDGIPTLETIESEERSTLMTKMASSLEIAFDEEKENMPVERKSNCNTNQSGIPEECPHAFARNDNDNDNDKKDGADNLCKFLPNRELRSLLTGGGESLFSIINSPRRLTRQKKLSGVSRKLGDYGCLPTLNSGNSPSARNKRIRDVSVQLVDSYSSSESSHGFSPERPQRNFSKYFGSSEGLTDCTECMQNVKTQSAPNPSSSLVSPGIGTKRKTFHGRNLNWPTAKRAKLVSELNTENEEYLIGKKQVHSPGYECPSPKKRRSAERHLGKLEQQPSSLCPASVALGSLVWAKLGFYPWWPAMIISHMDCGQNSTSSTASWVFWFGDHKVSELPHWRLADFVKEFSSLLCRATYKKMYQLALEEILLECCRRARLDYNPPLLDVWADNGFGGLAPSVFNPNSDAPIPDSIRQHLDLLKERISQSQCSKTYHPLKGCCLDDNDLALLDKIRKRTYSIEDVCIGCCLQKNVVIGQHPLFQGGVCKECREDLLESLFCYGQDGTNVYCVVCGNSGELFVCDEADCGRVYCHGCIEVLVNEMYVEHVQKTSPWKCFMCEDAGIGLLHPRDDWQKRIVKFFHRETQLEIEVDPACFQEKRPLRVLSLFDGIGTGMFVLKRLGLVIEKYYASEIDEDAINVAKLHFGDTIKQLGKVEDLTTNVVKSLCPIDLLIGGSPCNDLSIVNPARKGLSGDTGILFFDFYRILKLLQQCNPKEHHLFWLFENVVSMPIPFKEKISSFLECDPVLWDAQWFSAQKRARYFWGNIPGLYSSPAAVIDQSISGETNLDEMLTKNMSRKATVRKIRTVTTRTNSLLQGKCTQPVLMSGISDGLWITELERIFGFPTHYTDVGNLSTIKRQKLLGKAWSVHVVETILKPLTKFFQSHE